MDFLFWVLRLNLSLASYGHEILEGSPLAGLVLHAHDWMVGPGAQEVKSSWNLPLVATIHATEHGRHRGLYTLLQKSIHEIEKGLAHAADIIICCSRYMAGEVERLFSVPREKIRVIPNGVKPIPLRERKSESQQILFVGRLVPEKGVQVLISAFARLVALYPEARLVIAGVGPFMPRLKEQARALGIEDKVEFIGFVSERERDVLLAQSRITVFPSLYEPFGIVALEAMAAGVPVIVSRTGGLAEIVEEGVTGLTFTPGDPDDLLRCLVYLWQNPDLAWEMGCRARIKTERDYTWDAVADKTLKIYQDGSRWRYASRSHFFVQPYLPQSLQALLPLSLNLYWPRQEEVENLFRRLDPLLFEECGQNPYLMLHEDIPPAVGGSGQRGFLRQPFELALAGIPGLSQFLLYPLLNPLSTSPIFPPSSG